LNSDQNEQYFTLRLGCAYFDSTLTWPVAIGFELSIPSKLRYPVAESVVCVETTGEV